MNKFVFPMLGALILNGCRQDAPKNTTPQEVPKMEAPAAAMPAMDSAMSTAGAAANRSTPANKPAASATESPISTPKTDRKVIRTADLHFKVTNTEQATYKIEQLTRRFGGLVTHTNLQGDVIKEFDLPSGNDSTAHITHYEVRNEMTLRVPNEQLDTILTEISHFYLFLNHRRVSGEDVTAAYLGNRLKAQMRERTAHRLENAADAKGKRLDDISDIERQSAGLQETAIDEKLKNLQNDYNIAFSEVKLLVYQEPSVLKTIKANPASEIYAPSFSVRAMSAMQTGWAVILEIVIGILHFWSVLLLGFAAWWAYKKVKKYPFFQKN
jgi:Domain of unknown function (DUF4349)